MAIKDELKPYKVKGKSYTGVFYKEHVTRRHGISKDKLLIIRYTIAGKTRVETFGWESDGYTAQAAQSKIKTFRENNKTGQGPVSLTEENENQRLAIQAERKRQEIEAAEIQAAEFKNISFADFWEKHYFPHCKSTKKSGSWKTERSMFDHWITPLIGNRRFDEIAPLHLRGISKKMLDAGRAPASVRMAFCVVQQVWNMAKADGFTTAPCPTKDKTAGMPTKKSMNNERERFLTADEANALIDALRKVSGDVADAALLSLSTGMRASEVFSLEWADVNLDRASVRLLDTKTRSPRTVPLTETACKMLQERKSAVTPSGEDKGTTTAYVFTSRTGGPVKSVSATFERVVEALKLNKGITDRRKRLVFHSLRHSAASFLVQSGVPLFTVSKILGHSSMDMTKRYSHLAQADLDIAIKEIDKAMNPVEVVEAAQTAG